MNKAFSFFIYTFSFSDILVLWFRLSVLYFIYVNKFLREVGSYSVILEQLFLYFSGLPSLYAIFTLSGLYHPNL